MTPFHSRAGFRTLRVHQEYAAWVRNHPAFDRCDGPGFRYFEEDREQVHRLSIDRAGKEAMVVRSAWRTDRMNDGRAAGSPAKPRCARPRSPGAGPAFVSSGANDALGSDR